ncbi:SMP-30/gluconolactonase/LRE family protein [Wenxinia saemankumensis]|uniref:Gluconolactonase n=1 Tax=Wenxinia saemankumensis TaxID=1447782 RepID=A0A1M6GYN5_9RHOB|nr:SMP-30/gluconolactonase/LRE family protein [Wenxinia saemankumensis]SHJ15078.1 gluconolactonase [Wenxinia saemankumensis]
MPAPTDVEIHDPLFARYILHAARVKQLATGFDWVEGPVWFGDMNCLLFSEIPSSRMMRWSPETGLSVYRADSHFSNGNTRDRQGRLVTCEHGTRRVTRTEHDGSITVIADSFDGKRLNSPNDVVVARDGGIWFTDPHYGIGSNYEGHAAEAELPLQVYRADPDGFGLTLMIDDMTGPNGLAFSPDESLLYVANTGRMHMEDERGIRVYDMVGGRPMNGRPFHSVDVPASDGIRLDSDGNVWSSAGDGVHCISPEGRLLGKILVPERVSNVCFGGRARHELFITATTSLYRVALNRVGDQRP